MELTLKAEQSVNELLQSIHQEYVQIEAQHTNYERRGEQRVVFTVAEFSEQLIELERRFWEQLDTLLTSQQRVIARADLRLNPVNLQLQTAGADVPLNLQALFPLGHQECRVEIDKSGNLYQWTFYHGDSISSDRAATPPAAIRRLWDLSQEDDDLG
jgi:hypothetical protein